VAHVVGELEGCSSGDTMAKWRMWLESWRAAAVVTRWQSGACGWRAGGLQQWRHDGKVAHVVGELEGCSSGDTMAPDSPPDTTSTAAALRSV